VLATGIALAIVVVTANVFLLLNEPGPVTGTCTPARPCGPPRAEPILLGKRWVSLDLGYSFEYDAGWFETVAEDGHSVRLQLTGDMVLHGKTLHVKGAEVWVDGVRAVDKGPEQLLSDRRTALSRFGLVEDAHSATTILGPSIGYLSGVGGSFSGTVDANGPVGPMTVAIVAAGNNRVSAVLSFVIASNLDPEEVVALRGLADLVLKTWRWP
jgi:hypothetical protein